MSVGSEIHKWRKLRRISQLELSLELGVSSKHISFVETGRANPSRKLLEKIIAFLELPQEHAVALMAEAGFTHSTPNAAPLLEAASMEVVEKVLELYTPFPSVVLNYEYDIVACNRGFECLVAYLLDAPRCKPQSNMLELMLGEGRLIGYFENAELIRAVLIERVEKEALLYQSSRLAAYAKQYKVKSSTRAAVPDAAAMELVIRKEDIALHFYTMIARFGTPIDQGLKELRIETLFASDEVTRKYLETHPS